MPEGRVLNLNNAFVYEYQYKDHLGNLRVSFREANSVQYNAGLEETNNPQFDLDTNPIRNGERARAGSFSAKTNTAQPMALWKSMPVTKGDKVNINVWANYTQPSTSINNVFNFAPFFFNLGQNAGSFSEGNSPVRLEAGFNVLGFFVPNTNTSTNLPKSYLIYRFYDKNDVLLRTEFRLISNIANGNWENLQLPTFEANTNGKLEVFVFNESNINVWFDDIQIQHIPTLISQENHYYAFGLNAKEIEKEGKPNDRFQFMGVEKESSFGLDWTETDHRSYDSEVGRFWQVDKLTELYETETGYHYVSNNPISGTDPSGMCDGCPDKAKQGDKHVWEGGNFIFDNGKWILEKTVHLEEVTITPKKENDKESENTQESKVSEYRSPHNVQTLYNSYQRLNYYKPRVSLLTNLYFNGKINHQVYALMRYQVQFETKMRLTEVGKIVSESYLVGKPLHKQRKLAIDIASGKRNLSSNAFKTRESTTILARLGLYGSVLGLGYSAYQTSQNIIQSDNLTRTLTSETSGYLLSYSFGSQGAVAGAALSGPAAPVGAFVGGVVGAGVGFFVGSRLGENIYDFLFGE